jgi:transposase
MFYLAIDQHSKQLTVNLRDEDGEVCLRRQVSTSPERVRAFFEMLSERTSADQGYAAIVEICGFNDWLLAMLAEPWTKCREIVLVQPEKRGKQKTDRRDANKLGETLWVNRHRLLAGKPLQDVRRVLPPTAEEAADRQLTTLRQRHVNRRTRVINKAWRIVHKHNLQHERPTKGIKTKRARQWLSELDLPPMDRLELDQLLAEWEMLEKHLEKVDEEIADRHRQNSKAQLVSTIPGLAKYGGLAVASRVSQIERFPRGASLANFFGLAPGCRNSGNDDNNGKITKRGSSMVRSLLGQVVLHVLRKDAWMRRWYQQVKRRRGSKVARVAVMRRLATILWSMLKHNIRYICGGPEEFRKALECRDTLRQEARAAGV